MSLSLEAILAGLAVNTFGWVVACWCVKQWAGGVSRDIKDMRSSITALVTRGECQQIHNRIHARVDEVDAKQDSNGERIAKLEVAAGK